MKTNACSDINKSIKGLFTDKKVNNDKVNMIKLTFYDVLGFYTTKVHKSLYFIQNSQHNLIVCKITLIIKRIFSSFVFQLLFLFELWDDCTDRAKEASVERGMQESKIVDCRVIGENDTKIFTFLKLLVSLSFMLLHFISTHNSNTFLGDIFFVYRRFSNVYCL